MSERLGLAAILGLLAVFVLLPLGVLGAEALDPSVWARALDPLTLRALWNSALLCLGVLALALVIGLPLGWLLGRARLPGRAVWRTLLSVPYILPPYLGAIAWTQLLNPTTGLLNKVLMDHGLPALNIYSLGGMVWVIGLACAPFVFLGTADALGRVDPSLEEAARMAGASPARVLWDVTLPMALPAIAASASFVVAATSAAFGVPYLLTMGTSDPQPVLTTRIYQAMALDPATGRPVAISMAVLLLALGVGLPALAKRLEGRRSYVSVTGKAARGEGVGLGRYGALAQLGLGLYATIAVLLPAGTVAATSLMAHFGGGLGADNLTLSHWRQVLLERPDTLSALSRSLLLAAGSATAAAVVGGLVAWWAVRSRMRGRRALAFLARLPYAVPGTVLALGMLLAFSRPIRVIVAHRLTLGMALMDTSWLLGIAYAVKYLAFPVGNVEAALKGLDPTLEEAARMSGAGFGRVLKDVVVPLLLPGLIASWFLVAMPAFSEITMSVLLYGPRTPVVGTVLFNLQAYADPPAAAVLAVLVMATVLGVSAGARVLSGGRVGL